MVRRLNRFFLSLVLLCATCSRLQAETLWILHNALSISKKAAPLTLEQSAAWAMLFDKHQQLEAVLEIVLNAMHAHFGKKCLAPTAIERTLALFPGIDPFYNQCAWAYHLSGENDERALQLIRKIKHHSPYSLDTYAMILLRQGLPADALQTILPLLESLHPNPQSLASPAESITSIIALDHAGTLFYRNNYLPETVVAWSTADRIARHLLKRHAGYEEILLTQNLDYQQLKKKLAAAKIKLRQLKAASAP